jgi:hypothetical protein
MNSSLIDTDPRSAHDRLHAGVAATIDVYVDSSRSYAARGDVRLALLSMWAADVMVLQSLLWESGLGSAPDPDAQLIAVGQALEASLRAEADATDRPDSPLSALQRARTAMMSTFDESVHTMLLQRFVQVGHLDGLAAPAPGAAKLAQQARLGERSPQELAADLREAAADCMAVSAAMIRSGLTPDAIAQARMADLASFEAYLVEAALAVGDATLATVDLRWDIATSAVAGMHVPDGLSDAVYQLRELLVGCVGPAEGDALWATFEHVRSMAA